jgi:hypothetical protein
MRYQAAPNGSTASWWTDAAWPWISDWVATAGFGALVATIGVSITVSVSIRKNRHEVWWEQADWALARYFNRELGDEERQAAVRTVRVLLSSPLATPAEIHFLQEATLGTWAGTTTQMKSTFDAPGMPPEDVEGRDEEGRDDGNR